MRLSSEKYNEGQRIPVENFMSFEACDGVATIKKIFFATKPVFPTKRIIKSLHKHSNPPSSRTKHFKKEAIIILMHVRDCKTHITFKMAALLITTS